MSDGLLRVSEAAALEGEGPNTLTIRRSKTDQEGEGAVQYIGEPTVARVRAWLEAAGIVRLTEPHRKVASACVWSGTSVSSPK